MKNRKDFIDKIEKLENNNLNNLSETYTYSF